MASKLTRSQSSIADRSAARPFRITYSRSPEARTSSSRNRVCAKPERQSAWRALPSLRRGRPYEQKLGVRLTGHHPLQAETKVLAKGDGILQGTFATRVRSVRTFGRSSTRPATTIISIESPRSDLSLARGEVLRRRALWSGHAALRHSTGPGRRTSSSSSAPAWRGDGRDEDRRSQDHQRPSLAAGEIQEGGAAGAIENPPAVRVVNLRPRRVSARPRVLCMQEQQGICCRARLAVAESTKVSQLHSAMGPFASLCIYL